MDTIGLPRRRRSATTTRTRHRSGARAPSTRAHRAAASASTNCPTNAGGGMCCGRRRTSTVRSGLRPRSSVPAGPCRTGAYAGSSAGHEPQLGVVGTVELEHHAVPVAGGHRAPSHARVIVIAHAFVRRVERPALHAQDARALDPQLSRPRSCARAASCLGRSRLSTRRGRGSKARLQRRSNRRSPGTRCRERSRSVSIGAVPSTRTANPDCAKSAGASIASPMRAVPAENSSRMRAPVVA